MDDEKEIALLRKSIEHLEHYRKWHKDTFGVPNTDYRVELMLYFHRRRLNELLILKEQT